MARTHDGRVGLVHTMALDFPQESHVDAVDSALTLVLSSLIRALYDR